MGKDIRQTTEVKNAIVSGTHRTGKKGKERRDMKREEIFLGNGAIALGLLEAGCQVITSYPGTPSSEILPEVVRLMKSEELDTYVEWSTNEKVALDTAFAASITGKRAACCMKQVGLNVAADSLMSAAYHRQNRTPALWPALLRYLFLIPQIPKRQERWLDSP
jgi:hypothetical protein